MADCILDDRTIIALTGDEATHFLHNLITTNVETLGDKELRAGALLTPQGKVMFDFLISRMADGYRLDVPSAVTQDFVKRLTLYKLRAKVDIAVLDQTVAAVFREFDSISSGTDSSLVIDTRFPDGVMARRYGAKMEGSASRADYDALRITYGVVESGVDYALSDAFAHDVSLDQNGGVDFRKGCYVGQEVVSRMHHRKTARRRVVIVDGQNLEQESLLLANGKPAGTIGTIVGTQGLAIVRLDRVRDAMDAGAPVTVNDAPVSVTLPAHVSYGWPGDEADNA